MALGDFLETLTRAINERTMAKEFGPDFRERERRLQLQERTAGSADLLRRAQLKALTRTWDAKMRAAQQLHPELDPESALAALEGEDIKLKRDTDAARRDLAKAQTTKALRPEFRSPMRYTTDAGVFMRDPVSGQTTRLGDRPRSIRTSTGVAPDAPLGSPFELDVNGEKKVFFRTKSGVRPAGEVVPGATGLGRTAEQRNIEYHAGAVEPVFATVDEALKGLEDASGGPMGALPSAVPGTDAYWARRQYQDLAQNLLSTIVARQAGEGSRLSDQDRAAYAQAISVVRSTILLPGGVAQARKRLDLARKLLAEVESRRQGKPQANVPAPGGKPGGPPAEPSFADVEGEGSAGESEIDYFSLFPEDQE